MLDFVHMVCDEVHQLASYRQSLGNYGLGTI